MKSLMILVVDPNECCRTALAALLRAEGHEVMATGSWTTAERLASTAPFELLITELSLPYRAERELMSHLAERYGTRGILLSGYEEQLAGGWRQAGFSQFLYKPVGFQQIQSAIARTMSGHRGAEPLVVMESASLCWN